MNKRLENILKAMKDNNLKQILITDPSTIFYITSKWIHAGERMLAVLLKEDGEHRIFINKLFPVEEDLGIKKIWFTDTDDSIELVAEELIENEKLGIDKTWPSGFLIRLMEKNKVKDFTLSSDFVDDIRMIKDEEERRLMRQASKLNDEAMEILMGYIADNPNVTEEEATVFLRETYKDLNCDGFSFDPIVAYGANGADPHHETDSSTLKEGDSVILDIGCKKDSYCADMTRTVFFKKVSDKHREVYEIVKEANRLGIEAAKAGNTFAMVDKAARDYIESEGYGEYFTHRTGHSIGIDVHEKGDVSMSNDTKLKEGMVFSVEPGIYLPGEMGVRIEDLVLVTDDGNEVLNKVSKDIKII